MENIFTEEIWIKVAIFLIVLVYVFTNKYIVYNLLLGKSQSSWSFRMFMIFCSPLVVLIFIPIYSGQLVINGEIIIISQIIVNMIYYIARIQKAERQVKNDNFIKLILSNRYILLKSIEDKMLHDGLVKSIKDINENSSNSELFQLYKKLQKTDIEDIMVDDPKTKA